MAQLKSTTINGNLNVNGEGTSSFFTSKKCNWLEGLKTGTLNIQNMSTTDSYHPWISGTNSGSKKRFSMGVLNNCFYIIGSSDTKTDNSYDAAVYLDTASNRFYAKSMVTDDWFRSSGNTGWYNESYGGGWYMIDDQWIRAYNNKHIVTGGNIQAGADFISNGTRDWRFGCQVGTGDANQFGFYDTTYGLCCSIFGSDHSFRLNGEYWCNRNGSSWAFGSVTGTGDAHKFSFYDVNTNLIPLTADGNTGNIIVGQNTAGNTGVYIGPAAAGNRAFLYSSADYPGALWIQTRYNGNWVWYSLGQACSKALSDIRLKTDIKEPEVTNAMNVINTMQLHSFTRKDSHEKYRIGFIADELEQIDPTLTDGGGEVDGHPYYKSVNELQVTAYVVKALQELDKTNNELKIQNDKLKQKIDILEAKIDK